MPRPPYRATALALLCALLVGLVPAFSACSSTTIIQTDPPGARVWVDDAFIGRAPVVWSDTRRSGSTRVVRLQLEGHAPRTVALRRNEELDPGALVSGLLLLVPLFWVKGYSAEHSWRLDPVPAPAPLTPSE